MAGKRASDRATAVQDAMVKPSLLKADAIGVAQATVIGMATSAPAATVAISLAVIAATTAYSSGLILLIAAVPMLIIANAYRRLNLWNANCGASFEWVGRAISPYLGFITGWLMMVTYIVGTVAGVIVLGPSVLAVTRATSASTWASVGIAGAVTLVMLVLAVVGIRITARTQIGMAMIEYLILIGVAIVGLVFVLGHHSGTYPLTSSWFTFSGVGGRGSAVAGFLLVVFIYGGWDGTLYVNEEVKHRRVYPGRAAMIAVVLLAVIYTLVQVGLQGVVSPAKLQAHGGSALVYIAQTLGGSTLGQVMALAIALSVIATTGTGIVLGARIIYGMASYRALPGFLGGVSKRFSTPTAASIVVGALIAALSAVYLLATSVQTAFNNVIATAGELLAILYILTALAAMTYYRRRVAASLWDAITLGVLPLGAVGFLGYVLYRSIGSAWDSTSMRPQVWSLIGIVAAGLIMMLVARFGLRSVFFQLPRESEARQPAEPHLVGGTRS
jgi:amino acid transporter